MDAISGSAHDPDTGLTQYEDFKANYQDTQAQCHAQGITFLPKVMEAVGGGWGKVARGIWSELAKSSASASSEIPTESSFAMILRQRLSMTLHRENARACLRRF